MRLDPCLAFPLPVRLIGLLLVALCLGRPVQAQAPSPQTPSPLPTRAGAADPSAMTRPADSDTNAPETDQATPGAETNAPAPPGPSGGRDGSSPVPEPGAFFLVGTGLLGVALTARLRRRPKAKAGDAQN